MQYNNGQNQKFFTDLRGEIVFITGAPYKNRRDRRDLICSVSSVIKVTYTQPYLRRVFYNSHMVQPIV